MILEHVYVLTGYSSKKEMINDMGEGGGNFKSQVLEKARGHKILNKSGRADLDRLEGVFFIETIRKDKIG